MRFVVRENVTRISVTDSAFSSGEVGLWSYDPSSANQHVFDDFLVQNLGQGSVPGGKVVAAQKALAQSRMKTAARQGAMIKSAFTLTRQAGQVWTSYYYAGAARVAMREENDAGSEVYYILTDHLGSTSITVNDAGQRTAQVWYKPWGEVREVWGVLPTDRTFTGQREVEALDMLWYNARFYDAQLGRFNQPDTIIPEGLQGVQAWNRFTYSNNSPVRYVDPSGHFAFLPFALAVGAGTLIGALVSVAVNVGIQLAQTGTVDPKQVASAFAGGAIAGATVAIAAPASLAGYAIAGGVGNVLGGQASAAVDAALNPSGNGFPSDFSANGGLYDGNQPTNLVAAGVDFASGAALSAASAGIAHGLSSKLTIIQDPFAKPPSVPMGIHLNPKTDLISVPGYIAPAVRAPLAESSIGGAGAAGAIREVSRLTGDSAQELFLQMFSQYIKPVLVPGQ